MPRYFFHIRENSGLTWDGEGAECDDLDEARRTAVDKACAIWSKSPPTPDHNEHTFEVADETGKTVLTVPFSEAFAERAAT